MGSCSRVQTMVERAESLSDRNEQLVQSLTANQGRLFSFILALLPDGERARDVLQETNLVIWRKADEFAEGTNFWAWASKVAHFQVLSHFRGRQRERLVFDEGLIEKLAAVACRQADQDDDRFHALRSCLAKLHQGQLDLIRSRYVAGISVKALAEQSRQSADVVGMRLYRIRQSLMRCVERVLAGEQSR